jgi:hypothetical protein
MSDTALEVPGTVLLLAFSQRPTVFLFLVLFKQSSLIEAFKNFISNPGE